MYRTQCVLSLLLLCAGLAHTFDWEIIVSKNSQLHFYDIKGILTHTAVSPTGRTVRKLIHDPVYNRVLFSDDFNIVSFDIASKTTETLYNTPNSYVYGFAYDPVLELIFWSESNGRIYSASFNNDNSKQLILKETVHEMVVDSCAGFIYWITEDSHIMSAQFNGSNREFIIPSFSMYLLSIDQQAQKLYLYGNGLAYDVISPYLNTKDLYKLHQVAPQHSKDTIHRLTISNDHIYWKICAMYTGNCSIWKIPKNALKDRDEVRTRDFLVESNLFNVSVDYISTMAVKYNIEDVTRGNPNCNRLKSLIPNKSYVRLLCVHGTKVSGESRCECAQGYSGERCDVSLCHNYCFQGYCSVNAEGEPKCRCKAGYSGARCEVNVCQGYCLNDGVCSLNENSEPVCQCTAGYYSGARCEVNVTCQGYCLNDGVCSLNEDREPVCQCTAGYGGSRCDVTTSLVNCIQTCIRNSGVISTTEQEVKSTPTPESHNNKTVV